jgi:hypothetical protein
LDERENLRSGVQAVPLDVAYVVGARVIVITVNAPANIATSSAGSAASTPSRRAEAFEVLKAPRASEHQKRESNKRRKSKCQVNLASRSMWAAYR